MAKITGAELDTLIQIARRELIMRRRVYPWRVKQGRMEEDEAASEMAGMSMMIKFLEDLMKDGTAEVQAEQRLNI